METAHQHGLGYDVALHRLQHIGAAGIGMTFGVIQYMLGTRNLGDAGAAPAAATPEERATWRRQAQLAIGTLLALHAPRPLLVISSRRGTDDEEFPLEEAAKYLKEPYKRQRTVAE